MTSVTGEKGMLVLRFRPSMKLCTWRHSGRGLWREEQAVVSLTLGRWEQEHILNTHSVLYEALHYFNGLQ